MQFTIIFQQDSAIIPNSKITTIPIFHPRHYKTRPKKSLEIHHELNPLQPIIIHH